MSESATPQVADAESTDATAAAPSPSLFTMVAGDPAAMVCEGDVCYIPSPGE